MNAKTRLDLLLNQSIVSNHQDAYPASKLSSVMTTTAPPLPPRRDSSSMKHHRRRHPIEQNGEQKGTQPLLNSSTLDDLFRALTLECEQYLAASISSQKKISNQSIAQPSSTAVESNDEDYENLHPPLSLIQPLVSTNSSSLPLKTSIQVISPIKRHVVSITVSSKVTTPIKPSCPSPSSSVPTKTIPLPLPPPPPVPPPSIITRHSSEEDSNNKSSSSTTRKHRRRRTRRQYLSSTTPTTRSSSSSTERKDLPTEKKSVISKRSCSTDPRYQHHKSSHDNTNIASQKQSIKRPRRRDVSLQHHLSHSRRVPDSHLTPLSFLLTSTKSTSDFLDHSHPRTQRRSRLETVNHRSAALLDRIHPQFYRPSSNGNNTTKNNNILSHRIPSYPVY